MSLEAAASFQLVLALTRRSTRLTDTILVRAALIFLPRKEVEDEGQALEHVVWTILSISSHECQRFGTCCAGGKGGDADLQPCHTVYLQQFGERHDLV